MDGPNMDLEKDECEASTSKVRSRSSKRIERNISSKTPGSTIDSHKWSEEEKFKLAIALQKYGHSDLEKLHEEVPTKTPEQIRLFVYWILKKARNEFGDGSDPPKIKAQRKGHSLFSNAPIDQWLKIFESYNAFSNDDVREYIAKSFLFISRYEPHADPGDCGGVDYAAIYEFLYLILNGHPVKSVNKETASVILDGIGELISKIGVQNHEDELRFIDSVQRLVFKDNATKRHYGKEGKDNKSSGPVKTLMDVKGFNPLGIPYSMLKNDKLNKK